MTRAEAAEQLRTLATVVVRDLAAPALIRPRRDGWLIFIPGEGYAWYGTAEAAADAVLAGEHPGGIPAGLGLAKHPGDKRTGPGHAGTGGYLMPGSHGAHPPALAPGSTACGVPRTLVLAVPHALPGKPPSSLTSATRRGPVDPRAVAAGTPADPSASPEPLAIPPG